MNIWKELGRLQVEAEGTPVADGIAAVRRVLIMDQARQRVGTQHDQARYEIESGHRSRSTTLVIRGRVVRVPTRTVSLLKALAMAGEATLTRTQLAERIYGTTRPNQLNQITECGSALQGVLRANDYGLLLHRDQSNGYTLLCEPLTLAQAQEVREAAS